MPSCISDVTNQCYTARTFDLFFSIYLTSSGLSANSILYRHHQKGMLDVSLIRIWTMSLLKYLEFGISLKIKAQGQPYEFDCFFFTFAPFEVMRTARFFFLNV